MTCGGCGIEEFSERRLPLFCRVIPVIMNLKKIACYAPGIPVLHDFGEKLRRSQDSLDEQILVIREIHDYDMV
jgi:hypothetical protein